MVNKHLELGLCQINDYMLFLCFWTRVLFLLVTTGALTFYNEAR